MLAFRFQVGIFFFTETHSDRDFSFLRRQQPIDFKSVHIKNKTRVKIYAKSELVMINFRTF